LKLKKYWHSLVIELASLDISYQSGTYDITARETKEGNEFVHAYRKVGGSVAPSKSSFRISQLL